MCSSSTILRTSASNCLFSTSSKPSQRKSRFGASAIFVTPALRLVRSVASTRAVHGSRASTAAEALLPPSVAVIVTLAAGLTRAKSSPFARTSIRGLPESTLSTAFQVMPERVVTSATVSSSNRARTVKRMPSARRRIVSVDGVSHSSLIDSWTQTRIGIGPSSRTGGFVLTLASSTKLWRRGSVG